MNFIVDEAFILLPVLWVLGRMLKQVAVFPDKYIPLALLPVGIAGALGLMGPSARSAIQGVLLTGLAVYGNQVLKQLGKEE